MISSHLKVYHRDFDSNWELDDSWSMHCVHTARELIRSTRKSTGLVLDHQVHKFFESVHVNVRVFDTKYTYMYFYLKKYNLSKYKYCRPCSDPRRYEKPIEWKKLISGIVCLSEQQLKWATMHDLDCMSFLNAVVTHFTRNF